MNKSTPSVSLCAVMINPMTPDVINTVALCNSLGMPQGRFLSSYHSKRVQRIAQAYGWTTTKARCLRLTGSTLYLVRQAYLASLFRPGITRKGKVFVGHEGQGEPPTVPCVNEWFNLAWLQGAPTEAPA